jgi:uncharacterized cupredoxin-like copper-binding protein
MQLSDPSARRVPPGRTGTLVWTFNRPGEFTFACLFSGHYQAGMAGTIRVLSHAGHKD